MPEEINLKHGWLTKDIHSHSAGSDLSAQYVGDWTLIGAAVLRCGLWYTKRVDDRLWKSVFHLNCVDSL